MCARITSEWAREARIPPGTTWGGCREWTRAGRLILAGATLLAGLLAAAATEPIRGQPFTRSYPFDEIGVVSRGARLAFDSFGRLALVQAGACVVLNDTVWINLSTRDERVPDLAAIAQGADGRTYFGARGAWGIAEFDAEGKLRPLPHLPDAAPAWMTAAFFDDIITTKSGVYFGSWRGLVHWDIARQRAQFLETGQTSKIFRVGETIFVTADRGPIRRFDPQEGTLDPRPGPNLKGAMVQFAAPLDDKRTLLALNDGRLVVFDGREIETWAGQTQHGLSGRFSALQSLADGGVAVGIVGKGLFLLTVDGKMTLALTTDQYHLVTGLAAREAGVLWVATEGAIEKLLYGGALTTFGERLGLPVSWPILCQWGERTIVSSDGRLYEALSGEEGAPSRFHRMKTQPPVGAWAVATNGQQMIAGSGDGVFVAEIGGDFVPLATVERVGHLVMVGSDRCFAIGSKEIAVFQREGGRWVERVPRIPGIRYPAVAHAIGESVWVEMGPEGVARVSLEDGALKVWQIEPWPKTPWINVGAVDDIVILTGTDGERRYFDAKKNEWCQPAALQALLARSPFWVLRVRKDAAGTIWATHRAGVVTFTPRDGGYLMDSSRFDLGNDRDPFLHFLPDNQVWISTERTLHHVEPDAALHPAEVRRPAVVSMVDTRRNEEILTSGVLDQKALRLSYYQNSLAFRPFSGGYAWRRPPLYRLRLDGAGPWTELDAGSVFSLSDLDSGRHVLAIQTSENREGPAGTREIAFEILPPWYRTWLAYALYGLGGVFLFLTVIGLASYLARRRNRVLEALVRARTTELEVAMGRLNDETRNAATLAERNRMAGEIHDSMQQGLSGAIIQLDTTLKMRTVTDDVRSRLNVVRNMISYARHEVQHVVWDMESPLLEDTELGEALQKIAALINVGTVNIETRVEGTPIELPRATKHHLLRLAQEATTNAVRHAEAGHITIELHYAPDGILLTVVDDGIGFVPDETRFKAFGHFGLRGLRARAEKIGGTLTIESALGAGTVVRIVVPLQPAASTPLHAEAYSTDKNTHSLGR